MNILMTSDKMLKLTEITDVYQSSIKATPITIYVKQFIDNIDLLSFDLFLIYDNVMGERTMVSFEADPEREVYNGYLVYHTTLTSDMTYYGKKLKVSMVLSDGEYTVESSSTIIPIISASENPDRDDTIVSRVSQLEELYDTKIDKNQGVENAGKVLMVGSTGIVGCARLD